MGLDIVAYRKLKVVENPKFDEDEELENWDTEWLPGDNMKWSENHFPGRGEGINPDNVYTWEEQYNFRAGSYGGYNWWRSQLAEFANDDEFRELINFADNEGVIGYVVAKKLATDFSSNVLRASDYSKSLNDGGYWFEKYGEWQKAFEFASDNGAVNFC